MTVSYSLLFFLISCSVVQFAWIKRLRSAWGLRTFADVPNSRSSHVVLVPRGGGIVFAIAIVCGLLLSIAIEPVVPAGALISLTGFILLGVVSFIDDAFNLSAKLRLFFHLLSSALVLYPLLHVPFFSGAGFGFLIFLTVYGATAINFFNFADGINGYVALVGLFLSFTMITSVAPNLFAGVGLMGAVAVFLYFNLVRGQVFMGDVGSTALGLCALLIAETQLFYQSQTIQGLDFEGFVKIVLLNMSIWWVVWVDCGSMVLAKILCRFPLSQAHNVHMYQRLSRYFKSHAKTSLLLCLTQIVSFFALNELIKKEMVWLILSIFGALICIAFSNNLLALKHRQIESKLF